MIETFLFGAAVGAFGICILALKMITSAVNREEKRVVKIDNGIPSKVEEVNGVFYIYNADNNEFLAQGNTAQEILAHLNFRMPNAHIRVVEGESDVVKRLKSTLPAN